jgi:hypothetical protein
VILITQLLLLATHLKDLLLSMAVSRTHTAAPSATPLWFSCVLIRVCFCSSSCWLPTSRTSSVWRSVARILPRRAPRRFGSHACSFAFVSAAPPAGYPPQGPPPQYGGQSHAYCRAERHAALVLMRAHSRLFLQLLLLATHLKDLLLSMAVSRTHTAAPSATPLWFSCVLIRVCFCSSSCWLPTSRTSSSVWRSVARILPRRAPRRFGSHACSFAFVSAAPPAGYPPAY